MVLICNQYRFPINACVSTASDKDFLFLKRLVEPLKELIGVVVGDNGYFSGKHIQALYEDWDIFVKTPQIFKNVTEKTKNKFKKIYNDLAKTVQARLTYLQRKPSIEPSFSLIKEIFELTQEQQLPFKGLKSNETFLMTGVLCVQLLMYNNFVHKYPLRSTEDFLQIFR